MARALRAVLYTIAALTFLLGLWGILANLAIPLMPDYGKTEWNFFGPFEKWDDTGTLGSHRHERRIPWWALSFQTPCPYLDPWLAGPVGYGFYALCCVWGMGTMILLRWYSRSVAGRVCCLIGFGGIAAYLAFFAAIAAEASRAGLTP